MSGEFVDGPSHDRNNMNNTFANTDTPGKIETDVPEVWADGTKDGLPIFDVSKDDFYKNLKQDRRRTRFSSETAASKYLQGTRYNKSFFVRTRDENGDAFIRKVK